MKSFTRSLFRPVYQFLAKLWGWLTTPSDTVIEIGARRQAQFLAAISLLLLVMLSLQVSVALVTGRLELGITLAVVWIGVILAYGLSRSKSPQWGSVLLVYGFTLFAFILTGRHVSDVATTLYGMIPIAYLLAGVLLSIGWQIALVALVLVGSVVFGTMQTTIGVNMNLVGGNLIALGVVLIFSSKLRDGIERRRLEQVRQINRELRETQIAVQESEQRFRTFVEQSSEGLVMTDEHGIVIEWNQAQERLSDLPRDQAIGKPLWEMQLQMLEPGKRTSVNETRTYQLILTAIQTGDVPFLGTLQETPIYRRDGTSVIVQQTAFRIKTDQGYRLGSIAHDITEQKRAQMAVQESERRFRAFVEQSTDGLLLTDEQGIVIEQNLAHQKLTGVIHEEIIGQPIWDMLLSMIPPEKQSPAARQRFQESVQNTLRTGQGRFVGQAQEVEICRPDGTRAFVLQNTFLIKTERGYRLGSISHDITERKKVEAEREALIKDLEARNAELEQFTYTVSHDLKSPLITIRGFLGFIEKDAQSGNTPRLKMDIQRISNATDKMLRLLGELLELSRVGRLMNPSEMVPFEDLARIALESVDGRLKARGVTVILQPNLPSVYVDRQRLVEVLQNLLDNASKFMGDEPDPQIEIGQQGDQDGQSVFYVRDNGIGIAPKYHEQVFGLFNKLNPDIEGTGIGLALVKRIIEFHGGRIWIESDGAGRGSKFSFTLPRSAA